MHRECGCCECRAADWGAFCSHCGAPLVPQTDAQGIESRFQVLRTLLRNRVYQRLRGFVSLNSHVNQLKQALRLPRPDAAGIEWQYEALAAELLVVGQEVEIPSAFNALTLCLELLPPEQAQRVTPRKEQMQQLVDQFRTADKRIAKGETAGWKLSDWFAQVLKDLSFDAVAARAHLAASPEFWPQLARAFDPASVSRTQLRLACGRGAAALSAKDLGKAEQAFQQCLQTEADYLPALEGLVIVCASGKRYVEMLEHGRRAIELGTRDPDVFNSLAWHLANTEPFPPAEQHRALAAARRAVELAPLSAYLDTLAFVLNKLGWPVSAIGWARAAQQQNPEREVYQERVAEIVDVLLRAEDCQSEVEAALEGKLATTTDLPSGSFADDDFELCLEDASGSAALPADDVFLDDEGVNFDMDVEEDSGSQVIALDDVDLCMSDEFEVASPTLKGMAKKTAADLLEETTATSRGVFSAETAGADKVDCSLFAPPEAKPGASVMVQVFAHLPSQASEAQAAAQEFDDEATRRGRTSLGTQIARGSKLTFQLSFRELVVAAPVQELTWQGTPDSVQFEVVIPERMAAKTCLGELLVSQSGVPIGRIMFKLKVEADALEMPTEIHRRPTGEAQRFRKAFISYASQDRTEVLRRVQMLKLVGIEVFQDVLSLDPGERWEQAIYRHIDESDVFFLFWSSHAKASEWVEREWRYALLKKGEDSVRPVIIEGPPIVPPPADLSRLHFNDRLLYYMER